ncbi:MAG: hypothetical protein KDA78_02070 [Planctomycetaceae bacterium]|nr:hypothetical protein [Planctomycetaceae bacterium]
MRRISFLAFSIILAMQFVLPGNLQQAQAQDEVGLQALFREALLNEPPWGLRQDNFVGLSEEWQPWAQETSSLLNQLYGFDPLDLPAQQELLSKLRAQLNATYEGMQNSEVASDVDLLVDLEGKISRRLSLYEVILGMEPLANSDAEFKQIASLLQGLERYESDDRDVDIKLNQELPPSVPRLLAQLEQGSSQKLEDLHQAIRINYYNFNVRTFVSEPFADYAFHECRRECGPVCDCILGARVTGTQRTQSGVYIDYLPSDDEASFVIRVNGNTKSSTRGVTDQATVYSSGNHYFKGQKNIHFDGNRYTFSPASVYANANNHVLDAKLNRRGLLAKLIGDKIAYQKALEANPKAEMIAASKLRGRILPKFNQEIEDTFGDLNEENVKRRARMAEEGIAPNDVLARTDDDELRIAERLMNPGQLGADRSTTVFNSPTGMTLHIHESWINNALAIDTIDVKPSKLTDEPRAKDGIAFPDFAEQLMAKFRRAFESLDEPKDNSDADRSEKLLIYDVDPLHVQFEENQIKVILRVGLNPADTEKHYPPRRIELPISFQLDGDKIKLAVAGDVISTPLMERGDLDDKYEKGFAYAPIFNDRIRQRFADKVAEETIDRTFVFEADDEGKKIPVLIDSIHAVNGWLIVVIEADED